MKASAFALAAVLATSGLLTSGLCAVPAFAASTATDAYAANIRIQAEYLAQAGRLAGTHAASAALKTFGSHEASQQGAVIGALDTWQRRNDQTSQEPVVVASEESAMQTGRSVGKDTIIDLDTFTPPVGAGVLMPAAAMSLAHLDTLKGADFDAVYKPLQIGILKNIIGFYDAYSHTGDDPGLRAAAIRELPKVKASLAALEQI